MIQNKKVVVVLPAFNAELTLKPTFDDIPHHIIDEIVLVDDHSTDGTVQLAKQLGIKHIIEHQRNLGYGANQKNCYKKALSLEADIIVMLHPDYQYTPKLITAMSSIIAENVYQVVLGSRILGKGALKGGMPIYKYIANRILTLIQNLLMNQKMSEYHTGFRAFSKNVILDLNLDANSDDFVFDNQMLAQIAYKGYEMAEITCPTSYFKEASSINFQRSITYGWGVIMTSIKFFLQKKKLAKFDIFN